MSVHRLRAAFTLVEMLVVIAIIGILAALLLPAVQAARERGRQAQCTNNLKQLATAFHLHHDNHKLLPSGGWGSQWFGDGDRGGGKTQPGSWAFSVLPFMEESALFNLPVDGDPNQILASQRAGAAQAARNAVKGFYCPTRRMPRPYPTASATPLNADAYTEGARSDYGANAGDDKSLTWGAGPTESQALADQGFANLARCSGIVYQRSEIGLAGVLDGTSHMYMLGERQIDRKFWERGASNPAGNDGLCAWVGSDMDMHVWGADPPESDAKSGLSQRFGSAHQVVFYVALCDASVRSVRMNIAPDMHRKFSHRYDQQPASLD